MDLEDPVQRQAFFDVHRGLPREGPGNRASTLRALALAAADPHDLHRVLDLGCGPGMQTRDLAAALPGSRFLAVDLHHGFLREFTAMADQTGLAGRLTPVRADISRLPVRDASVDLIWCEGAAYIMGVAQALAAWRPLLRSGGVCAFTEVVWLRPDPPRPLREFWTAYDAMGDVDACRVVARDTGYTLLGDFVLPPEAWWNDYYRPMETRIDELEASAADDPSVATVLHGCRHEIDLYGRYGDWYGYAFFVCRKP